jgi:hypothetical protein
MMASAAARSRDSNTGDAMRLIRHIILALGLLTAAQAAHASEVRTVRVHFPHGASGTELHGHLAGHDTVHYLLGLRAGQMLRVELAGPGSVEFNVFEPGNVPGRDGALYVGSTGGPRMEVRTAHAGDYLVQVYLVRAAARRNEQANFTLRVSATGAPAAAAPATPHAGSHDARVPGTEFHATGTLPCARHAGQPMAQCRWGVVRTAGRGNGRITIFWPDGGTRVIFFEDGTPARYDESQADGGARMTVGQDGDLFHVRIGTQRFEIVQAAITGG